MEVQTLKVKKDGKVKNYPVSFGVNCWSEFELVSGKNYWQTFYDDKGVEKRMMDVNVQDLRAVNFAAFKAGALETNQDLDLTIYDIGNLLGDPEIMVQLQEIKLIADQGPQNGQDGKKPQPRRERRKKQMIK